MLPATKPIPYLGNQSWTSIHTVGITAQLQNSMVRKAYLLSNNAITNLKGGIHGWRRDESWLCHKPPEKKRHGKSSNDGLSILRGQVNPLGQPAWLLVFFSLFNCGNGIDKFWRHEVGSTAICYSRLFFMHLVPAGDGGAAGPGRLKEWAWEAFHALYEGIPWAAHCSRSFRVYKRSRNGSWRQILGVREEGWRGIGRTRRRWVGSRLSRQTGLSRCLGGLCWSGFVLRWWERRKASKDRGGYTWTKPAKIVEFSGSSLPPEARRRWSWQYTWLYNPREHWDHLCWSSSANLVLEGILQGRERITHHPPWFYIAELRTLQQAFHRSKYDLDLALPWVGGKSGADHL